MRRRGSRESRAGRRVLLAVMLALVSLLAACGAGSESSPTPSGVAAPGAALATVPPPPTLSATVIAGPAGGEPTATAPPATTAPLPGPVQVTPTAPSTGQGTIVAVPRDGHAFSGQDKLGAPGLGAFLFFDADG